VFDEPNPRLTDKLFLRNYARWPNIKQNIKSTSLSGYGFIDVYPTTCLIDPGGKVVALNLRG